MEGKRQTESVLAKLMGLERPPPSKLVVHGRRRVYSESYLQDIALISQQQKWSFDRFSLDVDDTMLERRDSSEDLRSYSSSEESLQRYKTENEMFQKLWLLNSSEKSYSSRGSACSQKKVESVSQNKMMLSSNGGKTKPFSTLRRKGECLGKRERDCSSGKEALKKGSMTTNGIAKQVADSLKHSVWHNYLKGSQKQDVLDSLPGKTVRKVGEECISNSMSFPSSRRSIFKNKKINAHKDWVLDLMDWDSSYSSSWREANCKSEEDLSTRNSASFSSLHLERDVSCEETPTTTIDSSEFVGNDLFEENSDNCVSPKEKCVKVVDATSQQLGDDTFMANGSHPYPMEAYKPNPNVASNIKDTSSDSHCGAFHGSELKLQQSVGTFHYPRAKRHKRVYNKDSKEGGAQNHSGNKNEETRALSYLIEVLAESGLQYDKLERCYKLGQPLENPLSPFVFDSLEKKYNKQQSWLKSDMKLFFDRIKCALSDILHPNTTINIWRTYKTDRLLFHCNQETISEELLNVLLNQEKEAKRMPSDKVVGLDCDWLDSEEDIMIVVKEIEEFLINELVEDIVSTELLI